ncbi:MAG TPA: hypothetical protein VNO32_07225 [Candidatus Acidoferrum sp.]|nr:hypothetical protein [Candidatus Acidoferrum sp.]
MTLRTMALLVGCSLLASSGYCCAQESENFPDSALTGEQWQQRVQDARRRSEEFVANARTHKDDPPPSDKVDAQAADRRAMHDPSLQRGDIIATSQGFFVFVGRDSEERQPSDFLPAPKPLYPP